MSTSPPPDAGRRRFIQGLAVGATALSLGMRPVRAAAGAAGPPVTAPSVLDGTDFDLRIGATPVNITGRERQAITVNGSLPAPVLRWREGDTVTLRVTNTLDEPTSIHWHGILVPAGMDGVPGLSFPGIAPGETFVYRFPVRQSGTYWYHSHSGMQEQLGLYGALVIEPREPDPVAADRDHVIVLSDWTDENPHRVLANLKKQPDYYNFRQRTVADFFRDARRDGLPRDGRRPGDVGLDAHESHGPRRRERLHLHLPDERPGSRRELDGAVPARRAGAPALRQCRRDDPVRRAHPGPADDGRGRRRPAGAAGDRRRVPHRQCRVLRRARHAGGRSRLHDLRPVHGPHRLCARGTLAPRPGMAADVPATDRPRAPDDGRHGPRRRCA